MLGIVKAIVAFSIIGWNSHVFAGWEYSKNDDAFSDADRSTVIAKGDSYESEAVLVIGLKCLDDGLNVLLGHKYLSGDSDDEVRVQLRVDKNESYGPKYWKLATGNRISWMPMADIPKMIREMRSGDRLHIRIIDPADGEVLTQSVRLQGFSAAIEKLPCYAR